MSWRFKNKLLLVAAMGTTLTGLHAVYATDVEFNIEAESEKDELETPHSGASLEEYYGEHITLNFKTPLAVSGTPGTVPAVAPLLLACGREQVKTDTTVTYVKGDATATNCLVRFGENSHNISNMLGTWSISFEKGGPKINWQFKGLFSAPIQSSAPPVVDWQRWKRPEVLGVANSSDFTLNGKKRTLHKLTIDEGNNVIFDRAINDEQIMITGHESTAKYTLSAEKLSAFNPFEAVGQVQTFEFSHGTADGKKVTIIGKSQLNHPKYASLESELTGYEFDTKLVPSGAGYDELTIVFQ